jgi:hypothetical protein
MAFLFDAGIFSVEGLSGEILPGTKLYWYESGTSTPLATYSNEALTTPNANPVLSDSEGRFPSIWLQDANYKLVMELPNGTQRTRDPIRNPGDGVFVSYTALASTATGKGAALVGTTTGDTVQDRFDGVNGTGPLVIAIAGQSNALGSNSGGPNPSNSKVHSWDAVTGAFVTGGQYTALPWTRSSPDGNEGRNNYALAAAHDLQARTGRDVYVILDATGGTSIDAWVASGTSSTRYAALKAKVEAALMTPELAGKAMIDMLIWAQGEEDYLDDFATHLANVVTLDTQLRAEPWMDDATPVMCMGMSNLHNRYAPDKALRHYCGKVNQNWTFVSMKGLPTLFDLTGAGDYTHFLGDSLYAGGLRVARAWFDGERSKEISVLPFWNRGNGELTLADPTAIASFDHLVSWGSRDKTSTAVSAHAASFSIAWGDDCIADGNYTFALGRSCETNNLANYTLVGGNTATADANGDNSIGWGFQIALNANYVAAFGRGHTMAVDGATAVGTFSDAAAINGSELAFRVGTGASSSARVNPFSVTKDGAVWALKEFRVGANKVLGAQGAAVADATDATSVITQLNALLSRLREHGLIAT